MARITAVDLFYLAMPEIRDIGDGSQDCLLVRVEAGPHVGWGECEASPLTSIASLVCPMSHSACKPVRDSLVGQRIDSVDDIRRIGNLVRAHSLDLLQADHTLSGIDIALWDLLGKRLSEPVYRLLGYEAAYPKMPYASVLFGDTPAETLAKAQGVRQQGYAAAKFGWGPYGRGSVQEDADQVHAAREGLGDEAYLLVDAGTVWGSDVDAARARLPALEAARATWLEEPFVSGAVESYRCLSRGCRRVRLAGGEGSHNAWMARQMIAHAGLGYVQIDAGRIGGITPAFDVARDAEAAHVTYVNHTFTTQLALSASLQPYAGMRLHELCEYPVEASALARDLTHETLVRDDAGRVHLPDEPGLGVTIDLDTVRIYLQDVTIVVNGETLYRTPAV
jgi:L-alanine-DL-glutamate epimerase-like enolase superfamily enzyme